MSVLLSRATSRAYANLVTGVVHTISERFRTVDRPSSGASLHTLETLVDRVSLNGPGVGTDRALEEVDTLVAEHAVWYHHPDYLAHLNCPVALPAVAADAVLSAVNPSIDTWDQSKAATLIERRVLRWTSDRIGFAAGDGVFTSGGTQSNMHALLLARETALEQLLHAEPTLSRPEAAARLTVFAGASAHFSVRKACFLLGLDDRAVVEVAEDARGRIDPAELDDHIAALAETGSWAMAVVATAGTTDRGSIDPLGAIAELAERRGIWLHVDAAYGCGLLLSPTRRSLLDGIERASSATVDFHKSLFQPVSSSALIVRDPRDLRRIRWHADYLNPVGDEEPNQVDVSLQTTRRADALKLWTTLRAVGPAELGRMFDRVLDTAAAVHAELAAHPEVDLVAPTDLSTVLFRVRPLGCSVEESGALVPGIRSTLLDRGTIHVAKTVIDGTPCLKLTLLNPDVEVTQVLDAVDRIVEVGRELLSGEGAGSSAMVVQGGHP